MPRKTYYAVDGGVNLRSCPQTSCERVASVAAGAALEVNGRVDDGQAVNAGNAVWYRVVYGEQIVYVYSGVVTDSPPVIQQAPPPASGGVSSPAQPPAPGFTCPRNCTEARALGLTAEQAGQCPHLDRDGDGVACYGD